MTTRPKLYDPEQKPTPLPHSQEYHMARGLERLMRLAGREEDAEEAKRIMEQMRKREVA